MASFIVFCKFWLQANLFSFAPCNPNDPISFIKDYNKWYVFIINFIVFSKLSLMFQNTRLFHIEQIRCSANPKLLHPHPPTELEEYSSFCAVHGIIRWVSDFLILCTRRLKSEWNVCVIPHDYSHIFIFFIPFILSKQLIFIKWSICQPTPLTCQKKIKFVINDFIKCFAVGNAVSTD